MVFVSDVYFFVVGLLLSFFFSFFFATVFEITSQEH